MKLTLKSNNQNLFANLINPEGFKKPLPSLIFIHGWKSDKKGNTKRAEEISKLGYICLCLDLRGHGDSEGKVEDFSRQDHLEDIKNAYKYLESLEEVDKDKIGIVGSSYGGYLAAVATNYLKFSRLVLRVPALYSEGIQPRSVTKGLYFDDKFNIPTDELINGDPKAFKTWNLTPEKSLALKGVKNFPGKILIVEAEKDTIIPHEVIENYMEVIKNKEQLTYLVMKNAAHSLETEEQEKKYIEILKTWLEENSAKLSIEA